MRLTVFWNSRSSAGADSFGRVSCIAFTSPPESGFLWRRVDSTTSRVLFTKSGAGSVRVRGSGS